VRDSIATFLQIDLQSLFGTSDRDRKLDFEKIHNYFNSRETEFLTGSCIYTIKSPDFDSSRFENKLRIIGYDIRVKNLPKIPRISKFQRAPYKSNFYNAPLPPPINLVSHVMPITIDCVYRINRFDKWIIFTNNNANFFDLCVFLKDQGKKIELWSFNDNYDPILEPYSERHFITEDFCLQQSNIDIFGANDGPNIRNIKM
jgi:hypothetical protein